MLETSNKNMPLKSRRRSDIFRDPIFRLANILGIMPYYDYNKEKVPHKNLFRLYGLLLSGFMMWTSILSCFQLYQGLVSVSPLLVSLEFLVISTFILLFLVSVLGSSFWNLKLWTHMIRLLSYSGIHFNRNWRTFLNIPHIFLFVGCFSTIILFIFMLYFMGIDYAQHILIFHLSRHIETCLIYNIITLLRRKYKTIHDTLVKLSFCTVIKSSTVKNIQELKKIYLETDKIVITFNRIFGWPLLLHFCQLMASLLLFLGLLTDHSLKVTMEKMISSEVIISNVLYTFMTLVSIK